MKDTNLSRGACVCADEDKTTLPERMRTTLSGSGCWCTHCEVPRKHRCCHWHSRYALSPRHKFSTFLKISLRVQILILFSCCSNSSSLFPVVILCTSFAPRKHVI